MNVAFVLAYLADRYGGPVSVAKAIGPRLADMGHDISYWSTSDGDDQGDSASLCNAHVYDVGWPHSWHRSRNLVRGLSANACSFDLMHISGFWLHPTYAASRIAQANDTPYILRPAGGLGHWRLRGSLIKRLKKRVYLNLAGKSMMEGAACLQAASEQEAEHFRQVGYSGPITIIPNGVDTNVFTPGDGAEANEYWPELKDRPVVLFMSRLSPEKGLDILIPVWAEFTRSAACKDAMLVIAGPDDRGYGRLVEAMIDRYNVGCHICMTGMVQGHKKLALLRRADIFVLPSYSENFGIVVAEALACGTPVITTTGTPWGQLREIDAGRWVAPAEAELCEALRELLNMSDSQRKAMGRRGRELVLQRYDWNKIARQLLTVYSCILNGKDVPLNPEPIELEVKSI